MATFRPVVRVLWRAKGWAGTARPRPLRIFAIAHSRFNFMQIGTQRAVRDMVFVEYGSSDLHGLERRDRHEV